MEYVGGALRYDMGERTQFIHVPMLCAALTQLLNWGVRNIYATLQNYTNQLAQSIDKMGIECVNVQYRAGHIPITPENAKFKPKYAALLGVLTSHLQV